MSFQVLMVGMAVAAVAGSIVSARAAQSAGEAQAQGAELEREQLEEEAELSELQAQQEENIRREQLRRLLGAQEAQAAAQGRAGLGSGTSLRAIQSDATTQAERDVRNIRVFGHTQTKRLRVGAEQASIEAGSARKVGNLKATASLFQGLGSAFGAGATAFGKPAP